MTDFDKWLDYKIGGEPSEPWNYWLRAAWTAATTAERERCAFLAECAVEPARLDAASGQETALTIAAVIRSAPAGETP